MHQPSPTHVPDLATDAEAEAFLEQDLSNLDFRQFTPKRFDADITPPGQKTD